MASWIWWWFCKGWIKSWSFLAGIYKRSCGFKMTRTFLGGGCMMLSINKYGCHSLHSTHSTAPDSSDSATSIDYATHWPTETAAAAAARFTSTRGNPLRPVLIFPFRSLRILLCNELYRTVQMSDFFGKFIHSSDNVASIDIICQIRVMCHSKFD